MHIKYDSYNVVNSLDEGLLLSLERDKAFPVMDSPYEPITGSSGDVIYSPIDIAFYNTEEFSKVGNHYLEHGVYTFLHPLYDKKEFDAFWDEEERKRKEGFTLPCSLITRGDGSYCLQDLHITGEHYGYLNYAPIKRVDESKLKELESYLLAGKDVKELGIEAKVTSLPQFFDSDYYYFKSVELARKVGKHLVVGKARRKGYSYKNGWISANRADLYPGTVTALGAFHSDSLYPEGTMAMTDRYLQHIAKHTDWAKRRLVDKEDFIKFGYKLNDGLGIERGYRSVVLCSSFAPNNAGALRGKDADFMLIEEAGKNPILHKILASTLPTLRSGTIVTGLLVVFGTGGGDDKDWEGFEQLFYAPSADDFLSFSNIWDEDSVGEECGFFVPSYMGKEGFVDRHGNSNVPGAVGYEEKQREIRKRSKSAKKLSDYIMEEPFSPKEAFSRSGGDFFPKVELEEQLRNVMKSDDIKALHRVGNLVHTSKGLVFKDKMFMDDAELRNSHNPILNYPLKKDDDAHGSFVMWSPPYRVNGVIPDNLYRIVHDPFALPKDTKEITSRDSLGAFYVYERTNNITPGLGDRLVAAFIGRPDTTEAYNEIMFKASEYYNAVIQFENDRGDVFSYARQRRLLHLLADEPDVVWKKALQTKKTGRKKGISINSSRKLEGVVYLRDWLIQKRGTDEFGNNLLNLHYIYDEALLKELLRFNLKGNFDRVSTLIVLMYDIREQVFIKINKPRVQDEQSTNVFDRELF
tara:strand:+ start:3484 stop:5730 length:2247 start_codon:yes stop_codon:yes gene_type:complete